MTAHGNATPSSDRPRRPYRLIVDIDQQQYDWLQEARVQDGLTRSDRIRALVALCRESSELRDRVAAKALEIRKDDNMKARGAKKT